MRFLSSNAAQGVRQNGALVSQMTMAVVRHEVHRDQQQAELPQ